MKKGTFFKLFAVIIVISSFITIYQHNRIIQLTYSKQRVEMKKEHLQKAIINLTVELSRLQDFTITQSVAMHQLRMSSLSVAQVITFTQPLIEKYHFKKGDETDQSNLSFMKNSCVGNCI